MSFVEKRYAVLCSYSNEMKDTQHAAIAVCVDSEAYMTVCKYVQLEAVFPDGTSFFF